MNSNEYSTMTLTLDQSTASVAAKSPAGVISCLSDYDPDAVPVALAQQIIAACLTPINAVEKLALRAALGRVLAADVMSPIDVPACDNSAMDGYAFRSDALQGTEASLLVIGTAWAGRPFGAAVGPGECVRIMTGAVMPTNCDTVIAQEFTQTPTAGSIAFAVDQIRAGDNRRLCGEDLQRGGCALPRGRMLRPAELGLLASLGFAEVAVTRRLRVAFFSTGDELRSVGEILDPGCVYDSNRYTLYGMLTRLGCDLIDMGVVPDDAASLEAALCSACEHADAIITSGGVSVGAADYTRQVMAKLGDVAFWKIGMRPGRPMAFGRIASRGRSALLFGLPGNPVAVMVTFYFLVRQALLALMGAEAPALPLLKAVSLDTIRKRPGRTEYQRGVVSTDLHGRQTVRITGAQGSGILRSMVEANCMIVLHDHQSSIQAGEVVDILLFEGLV